MLSIATSPSSAPIASYPVFFNLRHYPMRSLDQAQRRLSKDRAEIQKGNKNAEAVLMHEICHAALYESGIRSLDEHLEESIIEAICDVLNEGC